MDVTIKNYFNILPDLKKAISEAEFMVIDLEFTGLSSGGREVEPFPFDTPKQYYEKVYQKALDFLPLQFGLCIFNHDSKGNRYSYQAYNFYVLPFSKLKGFPDSTFQSQCSSLAFLSSCGFDFNKAFAEGIPFLTQADEDRLKLSIHERHEKMGRDNSNEPTEIPVPDDMKNHLQSNIKKIKEFLNDTSGTKSEHLILDHCNGFMRRLLYQEVPKQLGDVAHLETCDHSNFAMKVMRGGGEDFKRLREEEKKKREWNDFEEAIGLSHLIKMISNSGKLIVGHNCLLDICHMVNRFRYTLPSNYDNFKELVHHIFPRILDTKYMSSAQPFKDVIPQGPLAKLLETVSEDPFTMPTIEGSVDKHSYSDTVDKSHEGGYDAFITGKAFLAMCQFLAKEENRKFSNLESIHDLLDRFQNRLYLMRIQDVPYLTLGAPDTKPPRNHVFHLRFPRDWRQFEIVELFKPFGPVFVSFIDDRTAFVALHKKDQAKLVLKTVTGSDTYKVTSFSVFQKQGERKSPPKALPASPSLDLIRKRKKDGTDATDSPMIFKKHCSAEQSTTYAKRSIDPIPEETETENIVSDEMSSDSQGEEENTAKEFPESEVWG